MPHVICRPFLARARDAIATTPDALATISRAIEDVVLQGLPEARVAAGVGRLSQLVPHQQRYRALAAACRELVLVGVADWPAPIEGLTVAPLPADAPAASERFLTVSAPGFSVALIASAEPQGLSMAGDFQTLYTTDAALVDAFWRGLAGSLGLPWQPPAQRDPAAQQRHAALVGQRLIHHQRQHSLLAARSRSVGSALPTA